MANFKKVQTVMIGVVMSDMAVVGFTLDAYAGPAGSVSIKSEGVQQSRATDVRADS